MGKNLNTKTFDQKINGGNYTYKSSAAGGPGQMEFPAMHFIPADCAAMLKINGTTYDASVPFNCYDSPGRRRSSSTAHGRGDGPAVRATAGPSRLRVGVPDFRK